ncbi:GtrA family protein [Pseudogemmobacter humi]|uniref:GtrA-like protein n=1 Tax=Pseudogemmobacter humi TaxID=2483812 RepID=A0A3P5WXK4_9RHOB|nr:GtrA family protein [Pseudogemmobacter humi]VDC20199.1 GtrA-like protein [Pseudogemmobacter humi]
MSPRRLLRSTLGRFLLVGGGVALVYSVLTALATSVLPYPRPLMAVLIAMACVPPAFWCQRRFTFRDSTPRRHALAVYAAAQALGMAIVAGASALFSTGLFWPDTLVYLAASAVSAVASFAINRLVAFPANGRPRDHDI